MENRQVQLQIYLLILKRETCEYSLMDYQHLLLQLYYIETHSYFCCYNIWSKQMIDTDDDATTHK